MATVKKGNQLNPATLNDNTVVIVADPTSGEYQKTTLSALKAEILEEVPDPELPAQRITDSVSAVATIGAYREDANTNWCRYGQPLPIGNNQAIFFYSQQKLGNVYEQGQRWVYRIVTFDTATKKLSRGPLHVFEEAAGWADGSDLGGAGNGAGIVLPDGQIVYLYMRSVDGLISVWKKTSNVASPTQWSAASLVQDVDNGVQYVLGTNGDMVRIPEGDYEGRLVLPVWRINANATWNQGSMYSDDNGATWQFSSWITMPQQGSENTLTYCGDGSLLMTVRIEDTTTFPFRMSSRSLDGGATWLTPKKHYTLHCPACNASTTYYGKDASGRDVVLYSGPTYIHDVINVGMSNMRTNFQIRVSYDHGETWPISYYPFAEWQNGGYSTIKVDNSGLIWLGVESNADQYNQGFNTTESSRLWIGTLEELIAGQYQKTAAEWFAEYQRVVTIDGGEIIDEAETIQAIQFCLDQGLTAHNVPVAVSAMWGLKKTGTTLNFLYSLFSYLKLYRAGDNEQTFVAGTPNTIKGENLSYPTSDEFQGSFTGTFALAFAHKHIKVFNIFTNQGIDNDGAAGSPLGVYIYNPADPANGWVKLFYLDKTETSQIETDFILSGYEDFQGLAMFGDNTRGVYQNFKNGLVTNYTRIVAPTSGNLFDFTNPNNKIKAMMNAWRSNSGYSYGSENHTVEYWWLRDIAVSQAKALSQRLGTKY